MNKKIPTIFGLIILIIVISLVGISVLIKGKNNNKDDSISLNNLEKENEDIFCTQEMKQCSDGSYVSRTGPSCNFAECPKETTKKYCEDDERICFDGTILRRSLPDCELTECKNIEVVEKNGWKTWVNNEDNYSITYPSEFWPQNGHDLKNYNMKDPRYDSGNPEGISIQIQKHSVSRMGFDTINEYKEHLKTVPDVFADVATDVQLGEFISLYQYIKDGPGGAFANYMAFDSERGIFYNILVSEPGYKKNKELVEKILKTFKIL